MSTHLTPEDHINIASKLHYLNKELEGGVCYKTQNLTLDLYRYLHSDTNPLSSNETRLFGSYMDFLAGVSRRRSVRLTPEQMIRALSISSLEFFIHSDQFSERQTRALRSYYYTLPGDEGSETKASQHHLSIIYLLIASKQVLQLQNLCSFNPTPVEVRRAVKVMNIQEGSEV